MDILCCIPVVRSCPWILNLRSHGTAGLSNNLCPLSPNKSWFFVEIVSASCIQWSSLASSYVIGLFNWWAIIFCIPPLSWNCLPDQSWLPYVAKHILNVSQNCSRSLALSGHYILPMVTGIYYCAVGETSHSYPVFLCISNRLSSGIFSLFDSHPVPVFFYETLMVFGVVATPPSGSRWILAIFWLALHNYFSYSTFS